MLPKNIQRFFVQTQKSLVNGNNLIEGKLSCCGSDEFEVFAHGKIMCGLAHDMSIFPVDGEMAITAQCKMCEKPFSVFDSRCDGYDRIFSKSNIPIELRTVSCARCHSNTFGLFVRYEYPELQDLLDDGITDVDNAFTWIQISLKCCTCGANFKRFVDYETA